MELLHFEDFRVGDVHEYGTRTLSEAEIVAFAREFDPQPFHIDPVAAEASIFKGIIASGWHTAATCMRMMVDGYMGRAASLGSPGVDQLRWVRPVRPGDALSVRVTVLESVPSRSKPDRGTIKAQYEVLNQRREVVMTMTALGMFLRKSPAAVPGVPAP